MLLLSFIISYIIKEPIGEVPYLPKLENEGQLNSFLNTHSTSFIIFLPENETYSLDFANYIVSVYKGKISFALAIPEISKSQFNNTNHPIVIGYRSGKPVYYNGDYETTINLDPTVSNTNTYCRYLLGDRKRQLTSPEELRSILEGDELVVIGIDGAPRPKNFPKNHIFYETLSAIFRHFNINVSSGIYVYRPSDRQLIRVNNNNYKVYTKSYLTDIRNLIDKDFSHLTDKKYVAGYFMTNDNEKIANKETQILNQFAKSEKYKKDFYFSPIPKSKNNLICKAGRFSYFNSPSFIVVETQFLINSLEKEIDFPKEAKRWVVYDPIHVHDSQYLTTFIDKILKGEQTQPTIISNEIVKDDKSIYSIPESMQINYNDFDKIIESNRKAENDCFVVFLKESVPLRIKIILTIKKVQEMLNKEKVKFLFFDVSKNDLPEIIYQSIINNENIEIPFMVKFSTKENETLSNLRFYQSSFDLAEVINWVSTHSYTHFELPKFNETSIVDELVSLIPKKNKTVEFPTKEELESKGIKTEL